MTLTFRMKTNRAVILPQHMHDCEGNYYTQNHQAISATLRPNLIRNLAVNFDF